MGQIEGPRSWCVTQAIVVVEMACRTVPITSPDAIAEHIVDVAKKFEDYIYNEEEK